MRKEPYFDYVSEQASKSFIFLEKKKLSPQEQKKQEKRAEILGRPGRGIAYHKERRKLY